MEENPNLPDEILIEIFSRLPTKSAGRCRCLSKAWSRELSTSQFAHLHLSRRTTAVEKLLYIRGADDSFRTIDPPMGDGATSRRLDLEGVAWNDDGVTSIDLLGSCNGLVLLLTFEAKTNKLELFLVNPTTLHHFKLPQLPMVIHASAFMEPRFGIGYDSLHDDYKVAVLSNQCDGGNGRDKFIYSAKSGTWNKVVNDYLTGGFYNGAFVNGAIHWNHGPFVIVAFDLADDVFREIPPVPSTREALDFFMVLVIEGCLGIAHSFSYEKGEADIWIMKEYGIGDSWTRFTIDTNREYLIHRPLSPSCILGDTELLLVNYFEPKTMDRKVVVYNLKEGTTKAMVVDGVPALSFPGVVFDESLVSPNHQHSN